jgi:putative ABC transport system substrate-binding protein
LQSGVAAFEQALRAFGWRNGENIHIDYRWYSGNLERARADAAELVAQTPALIVTSSSSMLLAVMNLTNTIPIVFQAVTDPVEQGFVPNLAHPGGNITGFMTLEYSIGTKWLDLLKQVYPALTRVGFLYNPVSFPQFQRFLTHMEAAAPLVGVQVSPVPIPDRAEIEPAMARLSGPHAGLIVPTDTSLVVHHEQVVESAVRYQLPGIYARRAYVDAGGLMFYGTEGSLEGWRGVAIYADRILKGAKPGDLPVQAPINFQLVINLKAAKGFGLELPLSLLLRADEVIE